MRKDIQIVLWLLVFLLFMVSCENRIIKNEVSNGATEVTPGKMNSRKEIAIKSKQMIKLALSDQEETDAHENSNKKSTEDEKFTYTTEEISGAFISTIALHKNTVQSIYIHLYGHIHH